MPSKTDTLSQKAYKTLPQNTFGFRTARRRLELGLTQKEVMKQLAAVSGRRLGRTTMSVWESGGAEPSIRTIRGLARVLETTPGYLAFGPGYPRRVPSLRHRRMPG